MIFLEAFAVYDLLEFDVVGLEKLSECSDRFLEFFQEFKLGFGGINDWIFNAIFIPSTIVLLSGKGFEGCPEVL